MGRRVHGGVNVQRTTYTQLSKSIIMSPSHVLLLISLGLASVGRHYNYGSHHSSSSSRGSSADKTSVASLIGSTVEEVMVDSEVETAEEFMVDLEETVEVVDIMEELETRATLEGAIMVAVTVEEEEAATVLSSALLIY